MKFAWLALAGALGTLARYGLVELVIRVCGVGFPYGTLVVNGLGCFLFGAIWSFADERHLISSEMRVVILTGFMGAFTTFSTFAYETTALLRKAEWLYMGLNVFAQLGLGLLLMLIGLAVGKQV